MSQVEIESGGVTSVVGRATSSSLLISIHPAGTSAFEPLSPRLSDVLRLGAVDVTVVEDGSLVDDFGSLVEASVS